MGKKSKYATNDDDHSDAFISKVVGAAHVKSAPAEQLQEERSSTWTSDIYYRLENEERGGKRSCLSIFVLVISTVITMLGAGLVVLGIVQKERDVLPLCPGCRNLSTGLYISGSIVAAIGLIGILAAVTRRKVFAVPFTFLIAMLGIMFIVIGGGAVVYNASIDSIDLQSLWETTVQNDPSLICSIQNQLQCSGFRQGCCRGTSIANRNSTISVYDAPQLHFQSLLNDAANNTWCYFYLANGTTVDQNNTDISWPAKDCAPACIVENAAYTTTCNDALRHQIKKYLLPIAATGLGLGIIFLVLGGQAICMTRKK
jgi:hypothetical protein